ncbi:MAG: DUF4259 domain-containing protein [Betaproteobacteria bacterium]|nr:DUF4259 domain-containing protein [Betaproteobacteria bacterium]
MGAWGYKALESDEGLELIYFLKKKFTDANPDWKLSEIIKALKDEGFFGETFEDVDFLFDTDAIALTELYFEFLDNKKFDDKYDESGSFNKIRSFGSDANSLSFLLRYLKDIRDEVPDEDGIREIIELWKDSESFDKWKTHLLSLIDRLQKTIN